MELSRDNQKEHRAGPRSEKIRALIVDDEPLARSTLRLLLRCHPEIETVGECANGLEAVRAIREHKPELVFLDVQMPEMDGFEVLETVGAESVQAVVFVTAYDQYALKAFEVHALDFLLKPFDDERFEKALERAKEQVRHERVSRLSEKLVALLEYHNLHVHRGEAAAQENGAGYLQRLAVRSGGRVYFLKVNEIDWIEAADQYVQLHVGIKCHLLRDSISRLEGQLDPQMFFRIHRSALVNLERVKELEPSAYGDGVVILQDGTRLKLSRGRREKLEEALTYRV